MRATIKVDYGPGMLGDLLSDAARLAGALDAMIAFKACGDEFTVMGTLRSNLGGGKGIAIRYSPDGVAQLGSFDGIEWKFTDAIEKPLPAPFAEGYPPDVLDAAGDAYHALWKLDATRERRTWGEMSDEQRQDWTGRMLSAFHRSREKGA